MCKKAVLAAIVFLLFFEMAAAAGKEALTLEHIFGEGRYEENLIDDVLWLPDSSAFIYRQQIGKIDGLWRQEAMTGRVRLVADWTALNKNLEAARPDFRKPDLDNVNSHPSAGLKAAISPDGRQYLAYGRGDVYLLDLATGRFRFLTDCPSQERFAAFSPDGSQVAFTRDGDLFAVELSSGREKRLTDRGACNWLLNGEADWVYEEELDVARSFWWSPRSDQILFLQFDTSPVAPFPIPDHLAIDSRIEWQRYPQAGAANSRVKLMILDLASGASRALFDAGLTDDYLPRAGWWPEGSKVWYMALNRDQNRLELRTVEPATAASRAILSEEDRAWVNVAGGPFFVDAERFIWASERDGFRHLYLYRGDGMLVRQLTQGAWTVDEVIGQATPGERVLFRGNAGDPRESHLCSVALDGGAFDRLESIPGWHEAVASPDCRFLLDTHSDLGQPPRIDLLDAGGRKLRSICSEGIPALASVCLSTPELGSLKAADGTTLYWSMLRPADFDPKKKYPALVYVYGGPGVQMVTNQWQSSRGLFQQYLAERGLIVFTLDNRGSARRGCAFEQAVYRHLGQVEVADQVRGSQFLKSLPYVDPQRIGVYGGSYGGYMTLMCLNKAPDHFRMGVAYTPVADWNLYDSVYTERYMDRPQDNPEGYREGAPLRFAQGLAGPLLICQGTGDNNVHVQSTLQMADEYIQAGKQIQLMLYPRIRHGIRTSKYKLHFHTLKAQFLERWLIQGGPK